MEVWRWIVLQWVEFHVVAWEIRNRCVAQIYASSVEVFLLSGWVGAIYYRFVEVRRGYDHEFAIQFAINLAAWLLPHNSCCSCYQVRVRLKLKNRRPSVCHSPRILSGMAAVDQPLTYAANLQVGARNWTVVVQVLEIHPVHTTSLPNPPFTRRQKCYTVTDMEGTRFTICIYDRDIDFFNSKLHVYRRYRISNARVVQCPVQYRINGFPMSWTLRRAMPFTEIHDTEPYPLPCTYDPCMFSELYTHAGADTTVNVRGLIVHQLPVMNVSDTECAKDYVIVNEEEIPIIIRFWHDLLEEYVPDVEGARQTPVQIIATNVQVNTFHGLSLASRARTYVLQNPPCQPEQSLLLWYENNKEKVTGWVKNKAYKDASRLFPPPAPQAIINLTDAVENIEQTKTAWIETKVRLDVVYTALWTGSCSYCSKPVDASTKWHVTCSGCNKDCPVEPSIRLPIILFNDVTSVPSNLNSPDAEKLIPFTAAQIADFDIEELPVHHQIAEALDNSSVICLIKYYDRFYNGQQTRRYPVLKMYTPDELQTVHTARLAGIIPPPETPTLQASASEIGSPIGTPQSQTHAGSTSGSHEATNESNQKVTAAKRSLAFSPDVDAPDAENDGTATVATPQEVRAEVVKKSKTMDSTE